MTQRRLAANASFRLSESNVTHGMSGTAQTKSASAKLAESPFDRSAPGRNNKAIAADREPMLDGKP
jgi:hypothetical protein